jgi:hypothetical protein
VREVAETAARVGLTPAQLSGGEKIVFDPGSGSSRTSLLTLVVVPASAASASSSRKSRRSGWGAMNFALSTIKSD